MIVYNPHPRLIMVSSGAGWIMVPPEQEAEVPAEHARKYIEDGDLVDRTPPEPEPKAKPKAKAKAKPKTKAKTTKKAPKKASKD